MLKDYTAPVSNWLRAYPAPQIHVLQYERLTDLELESGILGELVAFLGARGMREMDAPRAGGGGGGRQI